ENAVGLCVAISGAKIAIRIIPVRIVIPKRDLRLRSKSRSQFGTRSRRWPVDGRGSATGATPAGPAGGPRGSWTWAKARTPLARAHARVEDEVQDVHDEVGRDHAQREHEQEALRERVVGTQRGSLQGVARAGVAEDELDEDEASHGRRELRR